MILGIIALVVFAVVGVVVIVLVFGFWYVVDQQTVRFIERFGRFVRIGTAGFNFKLPLIESVSDAFSLRVQQLNIETETKTKDNVFVLLAIAVQYAPIGSKLYDANYSLGDAKQQLVSFVNDSVRARVPELTLDDVFSQKDVIAKSIRESIGEQMAIYGYAIEAVLFTDIRPDQKVQEAMNEINAAQRLQVAAGAKAEAEKIVIVKNAEAQKESKILQGEGVAGERKAIVEGMKASIEDLAKATGMSEEDIIKYLQFTQYTDMLRDVGRVGTTIMLPSNPSEVMRSLLAAKVVGDN